MVTFFCSCFYLFIFLLFILWGGFIVSLHCRWRQQPGCIPHARHGLWLHAGGSCGWGGAMAGCSRERRTGWQRRAEKGGGRVSAHSPAGEEEQFEPKLLCDLNSPSHPLFACCWSMCRRFRKPCYTSSRASRCWSSPWATRRRRWQPRWCRSARSEPGRDGCRPPRRQRRTRTRQSRGWPKPARPRSRAWRRGSPSKTSVPWSATATPSWALQFPSPQEFPSRWPRPPVLLLRQQRRPVELPAATTWRSTRAPRPASLCAASTATGGTCCWFRAQLELPHVAWQSRLWTVNTETNGSGGWIETLPTSRVEGLTQFTDDSVHRNLSISW